MRAGRTNRRHDSEGIQHAPRLVEQALRSQHRPLEAGARTELEVRLGHSLSQLRIHEGGDAVAANRALGSRAFTLGKHIVLGASATASPAMRRQTLAHESVHAVQQRLGPSSGASLLHHKEAEREATDISTSLMREGTANSVPRRVATHVTSAVQCDLEDPARMTKVHESLFVSAPGGGGGGLQPWKDARGNEPGTAAAIIAQAKRAVLDLVRKNPESVGGTIPKKTTEQALDADALAMDERIRARFPLIQAPATPKTITDAVSVMGTSITTDTDFLHQWLANKLITWTDIEQFDIAETDSRFITMLDTLLADQDIGDHLRVLASRTGGFQRGEGTRREIFLHHGTSAAARRVVLIHELVHFYAHPRYREWVDTTTEPRFFNEGFTEWLAQRVMTEDEKEKRASYEERVKAIDQQIAAHVSEDDMVRAFFAGDIWRIESRSTVARREFSAASRIAAGASQNAESTASRTGPGINQEVARGVHYRFLNLGHDQSEPKPEHVTFFRDVKVRHLDAAPDAKIKFVGHASTPGSLEHNRDLSRRRALAFYRMARREGLPDARLTDATRPEHFGEARPTVTEEDAQTRAFNRRVEMFVRPAQEAARRPGEEVPGE